MSLNKQKLCLTIPSLGSGGMERVMSVLLDHFAQINDYEIHLILYGRTREVFYGIPEQVFLHKPSFEFNNRKRLWITIKTMLFIRRKLKNLNPNVVLSFGEVWNSFILLSTLGLNLSIYISDRCQPNKSLGLTNDLLRKILYPLASGIIAQTDIAKKIYQKKYGNHRITVIGNPINIIENGNFNNRENIVLSVGRLIESKNHDKLIRLFLSIDKPDWKLVIVGDDALKQNNMSKLKELISEHKAEDKVILAGKQKNIDDYYRKSKIFAFTSSSEGFPNVLGEAQSFGLAVIAFDCIAGPSDLIEDSKNGYLIPLSNYELFGEKLKILMDSETTRLQLGAEARKTVKAYEASSIAKQYFSFITGINESTPNKYRS